MVEFVVYSYWCVSVCCAFDALFLLQVTYFDFLAFTLINFHCSLRVYSPTGASLCVLRV